MKQTYKLLSYFLDSETPLYGTIKPVRIKQDRQIKAGDSCNTATVTFQNHSGTHIDAPRHFFDNGRRICDFSVEELIFDSPQVIDCPKRPDELIMPGDLKSVGECDLLLIRTGFHRYRKNISYRRNNPGISHEAALLIRRKYPRIRAIGIDSISISAYQRREEGRKAHKIFLQKDGFTGRPVCIIEDMNLSSNCKKLKKIFVVPFCLKKIDSAPCTVIGEFL